MNNGGDHTVRAVVWGEMFPWLIIVRALRLAMSFRLLALAAVAALLMATAWGLWGWVFGVNGHPTGWLAPYTKCAWLQLTSSVPDSPPGLGEISANRFLSENPIVRVATTINEPVHGGRYLHTTVRHLTCLIFCGLSSLAIWAFFGAAITRIAVVQLAANERLSTIAALRFACAKWFSYAGAPLLPFLAIFGLMIPVALLGLLMHSGVSLILAGLLWPIALLCALVMALLGVGVFFGWPLMWTTISTEGTDAFDALSRSFAYVFQSPLRYLFYAVVAGFLGMLGWIFVQNFAALVVWLSYWSASWGAGLSNTRAIVHPATDGDPHGMLTGFGMTLIRAWAGCVKLLAVGFLYSYFWTAMTAIYLLLRRDVDATETDEVFLDNDDLDDAESLPTIATDAAGAPVVAGSKDAAAEKSTESSDPSAPPIGGPAESGPTTSDGGDVPPSGDKFGNNLRDPNGEN